MPLPRSELRQSCYGGQCLPHTSWHELSSGRDLSGVDKLADEGDP
jgi:hypothetical protein